MVEENRVLESVYAAIDDLNARRSGSPELEKQPETQLFGQGSKLDSMGLVTLIVATEQKIAKDFGVALTLANEKALSLRNSPFRTIGTLSEYIGTLLEEKA